MTIDGTITAGIYHDLDITIPNNNNEGNHFSSTIDVNTSSGDPYASFTHAYSGSFNPQSYVNANFNSTDASALDDGVSSTNVGAITLGTLYASAGIVTINASDISGNGTITSYGGPTISVTNNGADYLILGAVDIPDLPGGEVNFTGSAGESSAQSAGITVDAENSTATSSVTIDEAYDSAVGTTSGDDGPGLFLTGTIDNLGGSVSITNIDGSLGQAGTIYGQQVNEFVPNGTVVITSSPYFSGSNPYSEWMDSSSMIWPGGNPDQAVPSANLAIAYVANSEYPGYSSDSALTQALIGSAGNAVATSNESDGFPNSFVPGENDSYIYFGDDVPFVEGDGSSSTAQSIADTLGTDSTYAISGSSHQWNSGYYPEIPLETLTSSVTSYATASLTGSESSSAIFGGQVVIDASLIDIDSEISAGQSTGWSVDLSSSLTTKLTYYDNLPVSGGLLSFYQYEYSHGEHASPDFSIPVADTSSIGSDDSLIDATYDASTNQITLDNVSTSSGGGSVTIEGHVLNTNAQSSGGILGEIHVNGGLGQVDVDNQTGLQLDIQDIYAGSDASLGSVSSEVDIIDKNQPTSTDQTLYVYTPGSGIDVYNGSGSKSVTSLENGTPTFVSGTSTSYTPEAGLRWQWQEYASLSRSISETTDSSGDITSWSIGDWTWNFPTGQPNDPWQYIVPGTTSDYSTSEEGTTVVDTSLENTAFQQSVTGSSSVGFTWIISYHKGHYGFAYGGYSDSSGSVDPYEYFFPTSASLTMTMSVKADNPIGIDFAGDSTGTIDIASNAAVYIDGKITNPDGNTTIGVSSGSISENSEEQIASDNLTLTASEGIGSSSTAVSAALTSGGVLSATAGKQGVYLSLGSGAVISTVSAETGSKYGDVVITATGDLSPESGLPSSTVNIAADDITLTSSGGEVGSPSSPFVISTNPTTKANGGTLGGDINVSAVDDIGLVQNSGDLEVGSLISSGDGAVYVDVAAGSIYDASGTTSSSTLSSDQIEAVWNDLHLTDSSFSQDNTVAAYQYQVESNYQQYWELLDNGSVSGGVYTLTSDATSIYEAAAAANDDVANPTDSQISAYAGNLYQTLVTYFDDNLPSGWQSTADFTTFNSSYTYTATSAQIADLTQNSVWTTAQLSYAIDSSALTASSGTPVGSGTPNVSGGQVTIDASGSMGELGKATKITLADLQDGNLTTTQISDLALATSPGDVVLVGTVDGHTVTCEFADEPSGFTLTGIEVTVTKPFFVAATENFSANAGDDAYLQSTNEDLPVQQIVIGGDADITAPESILAASGASTPQIQTDGDLTIVAGTGSLGTSSSQPLVVQIGGVLVEASAGNNLYLEQQTGDLTYEAIFAGGSAVLSVPDGSLSPDQAGEVITANALDLEVSGDVGSFTTSVVISLGSGDLTGNVTGDVYIESETGLTVGDFTSTDGSIELLVDSSSSGGTNDVDLGNISATSGDVTIEAEGGSIVNTNTDGSTNIAAHGLTLTAVDGDIGSSSNAVTIDTSSSSTGTVLAEAEAVYLDDVAGDLRLDSVQATSGDAVLTAAGSIVDGDDDSSVKVAGVNISLTSNTGTIGQSSHDLLIDASGTFNAQAQQSIFVTQNAGAFNIGTVASLSQVRLTDVETSAHTENMLLMSTSTISAGTTVLLQIGEGITVAAGSMITAGTAITIDGDYDNGVSFDPDPASTFNLFGELSGTSAQVNADDDGDVFNVGAVEQGTPLTIAATGTSDTFDVCSDAPTNDGDLTGIDDALTIQAGAGDNRLIVSDKGSTTTQTITFTSSSISGFGTGSIDYSASGKFIDDGGTADGILLISSDSGADTLDIQSTLSGSTTYLQGGAANDTVNVGNADDSLAGILGQLTIDGGGNNSTPTATLPNVSSSLYNSLPVGNTVNFNDYGDVSSGLTYGLDANTLTRTDLPHGIVYQNVQSVNLNTGLQSATVNVATTAADSNTVIQGGPDANTYNLAGTGAGSNVLVTAGGGGDSFYLQTSGAGSFTGLLGDNSNDVFYLSSNAASGIAPGLGSMNGLAGTIDISAGLDTGNRLLLDNSNGAVNSDLTMTASVITGLAPAIIDYGVNSLAMHGQVSESGAFTDGSADDGILLDASTLGSDTVKIQATLKDSTTKVLGGPDNDVFNVGTTVNSLANIAGMLTIDGQSNSASATTTLSCQNPSGSLSSSNTLATGDTVNFNDQGDSGSYTYTLTSSALNRSGAAQIAYSNFKTIVLNTSLGAGTVNVGSTPGNSNTTVNGSVNATPTGDTINVATTGNGSNVILDAGSGDTTFNVQGTGTGSFTNIVGNGGNDIIDVSSTAGDGSPGNTVGIGGTLCIDAGSGNDNRLEIDDTTGGATSDVTINADTITGLTTDAIFYQATNGHFLDSENTVNDGILIQGSSIGGNTFNIQSTLSGSTTQIDGDGGGDVFNVASDAPIAGSQLGDVPIDQGNVGGIEGTLTVQGGSGPDNRLIVSDASDAQGDGNVVVTSNSIMGLATATIYYSAAGSFNDPAQPTEYDGIVLQGSTGGTDDFNIQSTLSGSTTTVLGGPDNDTFNIGTPGNSLGGIQGTLTVNGEGNASTPENTTGPQNGDDSLSPPLSLPAGDTVNFDDQGDNTAGGFTYTLTASSLARTGLPQAIVYVGMETVNLNTALQSSIANVTSTAAHVDTTINGSLNATPTGDTITVASTGTGSIVNVIGGTGASTINLQATGTGSFTNITGNAGNDTVDVSSTAGTVDPGSVDGINGTVNIDAGAGTNNRLIVDDTTGSASTDATITSNTIVGLAPANIFYQATGGHFLDSNNTIDDGILIEGASSGGNIFNIQSTLAGSTTQIDGDGIDDVFNISSDAGTNNGNLGGIKGTLTVDGGTGFDNRLFVSDFGDSGTDNNVIVTSSSITDFAPAVIYYYAAGGGFNDPATTYADGILLRGSNSGGNTFNIQSTLAGSTTQVDGNGISDAFNVSSDAGTNNGTLAGILGSLTLVGGSGSANRLIISDYGNSTNAKNNVIQSTATVDGASFEQIINFTGNGGSTGGAVNYAAAGSFNDTTGQNDGILIIGSHNLATTFTFRTTLAASTIEVLGGLGNDAFNVGAPLTGLPGNAGNDGDLDLIQGLITIVGNGGNDSLEANDHGATGAFNYIVTPTNISNDPSTQPTVPTPTTPPPRTFAGIDYNSSANSAQNTVASMRLDGTDQVNIFSVTPSKIAAYTINGNLPVSGEPLPQGGDYLKLNTTGLAGGIGGRRLHITSVGNGFWSFTDGTMDVNFLSIERFNHVAATSTVSYTSTSALISALDAETGQVEYSVVVPDRDFEPVSIAFGDVNFDGLPDLIVGMGPDNLSTILIYSGTPNAVGAYPATLLTSFQAYDSAFKGGVNVAMGDVNGDGADDLIVAPASAMLDPQVTIYNGLDLLTSLATLGTFPAFESGYFGGVSIAAGDLTLHGYDDIVAGRSTDGLPTINVFDGESEGLVKTFYAFSTTFQGGESVAVGDYNGDGVPDIIVGAGAGIFGPNIYVFNGATLFTQSTPSLLTTLAAGSQSSRSGVFVETIPVNGGNPGFIERDYIVAVQPGQARDYFTWQATDTMFWQANVSGVVVSSAFDSQGDEDLLENNGVLYQWQGGSNLIVVSGYVASYEPDSGSSIYYLQSNGYLYFWQAGSATLIASGVSYFDLTAGGIATFSLPPLAVPTLTSPSGTLTASTGYDSPTFVWSSVSGAGSYMFYLFDNTVNEVLVYVSMAGTSWTPTAPLTPGHRYTWYMASTSTYGIDFWNPTGDTFSLAPLAVPALSTSLGGTISASAGYDLPTFSWSSIAGAGSYMLYLFDNSAQQAISYVNVDGTTWTPTASLAPGHSYTWYVASVSSNAEADFWNTRGATFSLAPLAIPTPGSPNGIVAVSTGFDSPTFSWSSVTGAGSYMFYLFDNSSNAGVYYVNVDGTSWTPPTPLTPGHIYTWYVGSANTDGQVGFWNTTGKTFSLTALARPTLGGSPNGVIAVNSGYDSPTFTWSNVTAAGSYVFYLFDDSANVAVDYLNVNGTSWTPATPLTPGHIYTWYAGSASSNAAADFWNTTGKTFSLTSLAVPTLSNPSGLLTAATGYDSPTFSWSSVTSAGGYLLYLFDDSANVANSYVSVSGTSWTPATPLSPGHTYTWYVASVSVNGQADFWYTTGTKFSLQALAAPALGNPSGALAADTGYEFPSLTWSSVTGAGSYMIYLFDNTANEAIYYINVSGTTWTPTTALTPGHTYTWYVASVSSNGQEILWNIAGKVFNLAS